MEHWHPQSGLLLRARRRPDPRSRTLLHHQPHPADRAGEEGSRPSRNAADAAHHRERPAQRRDGAGGDPDDHPRPAPLRKRRRRDAERQLGRLQHGHAPMELYGEGGTVYVPDPNFFGGEVRYTKDGKTVTNAPAWDHPFSKPNDNMPSACWRIIAPPALPTWARHPRRPAASLLAGTGAARRRRHDCHPEVGRRRASSST